jgi:hypothetical protein
MKIVSTPSSFSCPPPVAQPRQDSRSLAHSPAPPLARSLSAPPPANLACRHPAALPTSDVLAPRRSTAKAALGVVNELVCLITLPICTQFTVHRLASLLARVAALRFVPTVCWLLRSSHVWGSVLGTLWVCSCDFRGDWAGDLCSSVLAFNRDAWELQQNSSNWNGTTNNLELVFYSLLLLSGSRLVAWCQLC